MSWRVAPWIYTVSPYTFNRERKGIFEFCLDDLTKVIPGVQRLLLDFIRAIKAGGFHDAIIARATHSSLANFLLQFK